MLSAWRGPAAWSAHPVVVMLDWKNAYRTRLVKP
jgi:hypothetical protein